MKMNWIYIHPVNAAFFCTVLGCSLLHLIHTLVLLLLHTPLKQPIFPHSFHFFPYARHYLWGWLDLQYWHACFADIFYQYQWPSWTIFICCLWPFPFIKFFCLSEAIHNGRLGFYSLSPAQHIFTSISCIFVSSLIISANMSVSFRPWINCSFNCLSISLYLHSIAARLSLPIHSSEFSPFCLLNLQNCNGFIISLNWGPNLFIRISNKPSNELHFLFPHVLMIL